MSTAIDTVILLFCGSGLPTAEGKESFRASSKVSLIMVVFALRGSHLLDFLL